jgi:hypothetical protein
MHAHLHSVFGNVHFDGTVRAVEASVDPGDGW